MMFDSRLFEIVKKAMESCNYELTVESIAEAMDVARNNESEMEYILQRFDKELQKIVEMEGRLCVVIV